MIPYTSWVISAIKVIEQQSGICSSWKDIKSLLSAIMIGRPYRIRKPWNTLRIPVQWCMWQTAISRFAFAIFQLQNGMAFHMVPGTSMGIFTIGRTKPMNLCGQEKGRWMPAVWSITTPRQPSRNFYKITRIFETKQEKQSMHMSELYPEHLHIASNNSTCRVYEDWRKKYYRRSG